jgi:hypothetical protein
MIHVRGAVCLCIFMVAGLPAGARELGWADRLEAERPCARSPTRTGFLRTVRSRSRFRRRLSGNASRTTRELSLACRGWCGTHRSMRPLSIVRCSASDAYAMAGETGRDGSGPPRTTLPLFRECVARPVLVEKTVASFFFTWDPTIHAAARREAEDLHHRLLAGSLSPGASIPCARRTNAARDGRRAGFVSPSVPARGIARDGGRWRAGSGPSSEAGFDRLRLPGPRSCPANIGTGDRESVTRSSSVRVLLEDVWETAVPRRHGYSVPKMTWERLVGSGFVALRRSAQFYGSGWERTQCPFSKTTRVSTFSGCHQGRSPQG